MRRERVGAPDDRSRVPEEADETVVSGVSRKRDARSVVCIFRARRSESFFFFLFFPSSFGPRFLHVFFTRKREEKEEEKIARSFTEVYSETELVGWYCVAKNANNPEFFCVFGLFEKERDAFFYYF